MASGQKLQDDMDADEARPAGDQNSAHDPHSPQAGDPVCADERRGSFRRLASIGGITQQC